MKSLINVGENEIKIVFKSPVNYVSDKYKKCPTPVNSNGQNGIVHIRKPQSHFGWDWGPVLPLSDLFRRESAARHRCEWQFNDKTGPATVSALTKGSPTVTLRNGLHQGGDLNPHRHHVLWRPAVGKGLKNTTFTARSARLGHGHRHV